MSYYTALYCLCGFFFFKQKTAYDMRISDWSSDVCSSDLMGRNIASRGRSARGPVADFNLLFASRRAPKQEPPASEEASGLGVSAQAGREGKGARANEGSEVA